MRGAPAGGSAGKIARLPRPPPRLPQLPRQCVPDFQACTVDKLRGATKGCANAPSGSSAGFAPGHGRTAFPIARFAVLFGDGAREALGETLVQPFAAPRRLDSASPSARRPPRYGAAASPFRRNSHPVPARLGPRLERSRRAKRGGQTGESRFSAAICLFHDGFRLKTQTNGRFHACNRSVLVPMRIFSHRHENLFSWARESRLFVASCGRTGQGVFACLREISALAGGTV